MEVIYNGIDIDETIKLSSVEAPNIPSNGGIRILLPGTLTENKNQDTAIRGLAKYVHKGGDACLWLAGDFTPGLFDEYARSLPVLAENLNVSDRVHFLGWRNDIPAVMARSDVVVLTSYSEGLPIVLLEAMCLKKPVIATRVGGIPEVVRDGIDGILIEPGDSEGFAGAVSRLADPSLRKKMGQAGFERVKSCFDIKVTARRFLEAIDKIC
jgi:glycosyltransferase involved in cell wall biosynthesis